MPIKEPKYKQLERRIKELAKERRQTETHIRKLEDSLKLWRERLRIPMREERRILNACS